MKWIKDNWKVVLIISFWITIPINIIIHYYFWEISAEMFDHVLSPIGGLLSAVLLFIAVRQSAKIIKISQQQTAIAHDQIRISQSQSILHFYEEKFDRIKEKWESDSGLPQNKYLRSAHVVTAKTLVDDVHDSYNKLRLDDSFQIVMKEYREGRVISLINLRNTNFWHDLDFLNAVIVDALVEYKRIQNFVVEINNSNLIYLDQKLLKGKIREVLLYKYLSFFENNDSDRDTSSYLIPITTRTTEGGYVDFQQIHRTEFRKYYDFFKAELTINPC